MLENQKLHDILDSDVVDSLVYGQLIESLMYLLISGLIHALH